MTRELNTFEIRLLDRDLGESSQNEAIVLIDGEDRLALLDRDEASTGNSLIGRYPNEVIGPGSPLLPTDEPHDAFVAVCSCGFLRCGALVARITRTGDTVTWDRLRSGTETRPNSTALQAGPWSFDSTEYIDAALGRGGVLSDWAPTTRRAALLANEHLRSWSDERLRLRACTAEELGDERLLLKAIFGQRGDEDRAFMRGVLRREPAETAEALADRAVTYFTTGSMLNDHEATRHSF